MSDAANPKSSFGTRSMILFELVCFHSFLDQPVQFFELLLEGHDLNAFLLWIANVLSNGACIEEFESTFWLILRSLEGFVHACQLVFGFYVSDPS